MSESEDKWRLALPAYEDAERDDIIAKRGNQMIDVHEIERRLGAESELRASLLEIKELLGPSSGYHIAPDNPPGEFGECFRIGSIFERADKALGIEPEED